MLAKTRQDDLLPPDKTNFCLTVFPNKGEMAPISKLGRQILFLRKDEE